MVPRNFIVNFKMVKVSVFWLLYLSYHFQGIEGYLQVDNVAHKMTTSSSGDLNANSASSMAADGSRDGVTANKKCAVVNKKATRTWLAIDLKVVRQIDRIVIATRKEDPTHSANFKVMCTQTFVPAKWTSNVFSTCYTRVAALGPEEVIAVECQEICIGRYIVIEKTKNFATEYLQVCELEAYTPNAYWNVALGMKVIHHSQAPSSVVTDGLPNPAKCSAVDLKDGANHQWMRIDLGTERAVVMITMTVPSKTADAKRLSTYKLIVSNKASKPELEDPSTICAQVGKLPAGAKSISAQCPRELVGQYVYLLKENAPYNPPVVCEIVVIGYDVKYSERDNLASCKPTHMIGNSPDSKHGVDDDLHRTCLSTSGTSTNDWWAVDLGALYQIYAISVVNKDDATYKFLGKFKIMTSTNLDTNDVMKSNQMMSCHEQTTEIARNHGQLIQCTARVYGRYVILVKTLKEKLQFCHVGVFGTKYRDNLALGRPTSHSSTSNGLKSHLAVDGKWDWELKFMTCAVTNAVANSWFQVDLGASYNIRAVAVQSNLKECKADCLGMNDFKILVGATFKAPVDPKLFTTCYTHKKVKPTTVVQTFYCTAASIGRHVVIQNAAAVSLTICELALYGEHMYDNLAFESTARSASSFRSPWELNYVVDGSRSCVGNVLAANGLSHNEEWVVVTLARAYSVRRVIVTQPTDNIRKRSTLEVNVVATISQLNKPDTSVFDLCGMYYDYGPGTQDIICSRAYSGSYLKLTRRDHNRQTFWLCEVEVYGSLKQTNLAAYQTSMQSNELTTTLSYMNTVDGARSPALAHCSNTAGMLEREWVAVDLAGNYTIEKVILLNSEGHLNRSLALTKVLVYEEFDPKSYEQQSYFLCAEVDEHLQPSEDRQFGCPQYVTGQFVVVMKFNAIDNPFSVCELEVYGKIFVESRDNAMHPWASVYLSTILPAPYHCSYTTGTQKVEWYAADLFTFWTVKSVVFTTKGGPYGKKITSDLHILTFDDFLPEDMNNVYPGSYAGTGNSRTKPMTPKTCLKKTYTLMVGEDIQMDCAASATGRFIVIAKTNAQNNSLQLCDLRVYAVKIPVPAGHATGVPTPPPTTTAPPPPPPPKPERTAPPPEPEAPASSLGAIIGAVVGVLVVGGGVGAAFAVMKKKQLGPFATKARTINVKPNASGDQQSIVESVDDRPRSVSSVKTIVPGQDGASGVS